LEIFTQNIGSLLQHLLKLLNISALDRTMNGIAHEGAEMVAGEGFFVSSFREHEGVLNSRFLIL
jgi:hypothetical protein